MNEELKIIIKAVTDEAKKNLANVKKELGEIEKSSQEAGLTVDKALRGVAKGAAVAVGAIAAVTTAMVALGKRSQDVNKGFERLKTSFENAGSSAKDATKYYRELYSILGNHDQAVESGQSFARITTDPSALNDYKNITAGGVSQYGEGYNPEALAENISETIAAAKVTGDLERVLIEAGISAEGFNATLEQISSTEEREVVVRNLLNGILGNAGKAYIAANQATIQYNQAQADLNIALSQAAAYTTPFLTSVTNLGATLLTVLGPALQNVSIYLTAFIQLIADAIMWVGSFFGMFSSQAEQSKANIAGYQAAMKNYMNQLRDAFGSSNEELENTNDKLKELKKQTMGFDELNVVSDPSSAINASGSGNQNTGMKIPSAPNPEDYGIGDTTTFDNINKSIEEAKEKIKGVLALVALVGTAFLAWKLYDLGPDLLKALSLIKQFKGNLNTLNEYTDITGDKAGTLALKIQKVGGVLLIVAGAMLLVKGYTDAWVNGIDWGNFATMIGGIALIVGGLALVFGATGAGIGLLVGAIALVVIGVKDFIENGYSLQNILTITIGIIMGIVGALLIFNATLLANPITWIVIAIVALVAAFVILWNECDVFREFWINLWEKAKELFEKFWASIEPLIDALVEAFKQAWELIKVIWNDYLVPLFQAAWVAIKFVWDAVKPYFENIWGGIKLIFSIVGDVLGGYFRVAWEIIKGVWSVVVSYFTTIFKNLGLVFSAVKNVLTGNFSEAWENIKQIFSNVGSFFTGVWDTIKGVFSKVGEIIGKTISDTVKKAINSVLSSAVKLINGFISAINTAISVINAIPGVSIKKLDKLDVPQLATGGIVSSATMAVIGERGREAVLPLENNTGWMDTLADRIANRNNTPSRIVLMLDGKELGWATINNINNITRQNGELPLVIV